MEIERATYMAWKWNGQDYDHICTEQFETRQDLDTHLSIAGWDRYIVERTDWGSQNEEDCEITTVIVEEVKL